MVVIFLHSDFPVAKKHFHVYRVCVCVSMPHN